MVTAVLMTVAVGMAGLSGAVAAGEPSRAAALAKAPRIKEIDIYKAFPLFQREVINAMNVYPGDVFSAADLDAPARSVTALFKDQGYTDPRVRVDAEQDPADGHYRLKVHIDKGDYYRTGRVDIQGNEHVSDTTLKMRISTWKASLLFAGAGRFVRKDLDADVRNFVEFYRRKGFFDVRVTADTMVNEAKKIVDVRFHIQEGFRYDVGFDGNHQFMDFTLKKEAATLYKNGNPNQFGVKKTIRGIKRRYVEKGYLDADIKARIPDDPSDASGVRRLVFNIDEGLPYRVTRMGITGNRALSVQTIQDHMLTRADSRGDAGAYVTDWLDEDIRGIKALYARHGFLSADVTRRVDIAKQTGTENRELFAVAVDLEIAEGVQTLVDRVGVSESPALAEETALAVIGLTPGTGFDESMMIEGEDRLRQTLSEKGYPHAAVTAETTFTPDGSGVRVFYAVDPGPRVLVGEVMYAGHFKTRTRILEKEMTVKPGDVFQVSQVHESRRRLMDLQALDSAQVRTVGLKSRKERVDVLVEVAEKKPYVFETGIGYDTERHAYVNTQIRDRNFSGQNLSLQSEAEISQIGYKVNASLTDPRFLATSIKSITRAYSEDREEFNKDFGTLTHGVSQDFSRSFLDGRLTANLGFVYEFREQYLSGDRQGLDNPSELDDRRSIVAASPGLVFKTTDSHVRPRKGVFSTLNLDISKGLENNLDDFIKYRLESRYYYTPFEPLTLAVRARYGLIQPYGGSGRVPDDQLFFLGGTSTVRGFEENMLRVDADGQARGGQEAVLGSLEARYDIGMNLELALFYDIGSVGRTQGEAVSESFRDAVGLGLRYMTPIGPIGLLYGHKLSPDPHESSGCFHFSMGYTF